jgi:hypothetical protein
MISMKGKCSKPKPNQTKALDEVEQPMAMFDQLNLAQDKVVYPINRKWSFCNWSL